MYFVITGFPFMMVILFLLRIFFLLNIEIKFMLLKCTIQRLLVYLLCCAAIDTIHVQNFFIIPNRSSVFIKKKKQLPTCVFPWSLVTFVILVNFVVLSVCVNLPLLGTSCKCNHKIFVFLGLSCFLVFKHGSGMFSEFIHVVA